MKGYKLIIKILTVTAFVLIIIMVSLNLHPSWSQYARSLHEPFLLAALSAISGMFLIRSFTHKQRNRVLFTFKKISVRIEHLNRYAGFFFIGVLCTPVTHPEWYIETAHLIFTPLAIGFAHLELWFYYKKGVQRWGSLFGSVIGVLGFLGGLLTNVYTIGMGELLAALPIIIHVLTTNKK